MDEYDINAVFRDHWIEFNWEKGEWKKRKKDEDVGEFESVKFKNKDEEEGDG